MEESTSYASKYVGRKGRVGWDRIGRIGYGFYGGWVHTVRGFTLARRRRRHEAELANKNGKATMTEWHVSSMIHVYSIATYGDLAPRPRYMM